MLAECHSRITSAIMPIVIGTTAENRRRTREKSVNGTGDHPQSDSHPAVDLEAARLDALGSYRILDTAAEPMFDDLTRLAAQICDTPISLLAFIDVNRQWNKSNV